ncbi:MAG: hypothetical protein HRT35_18400 [Algicola sp.]|nr:hypothetical protein [Algicola sp.]
MKSLSLAVLCLLVTSGCTSVDYSGQEVGVDPILAQHADNYPITKKDAFWAEDQLNVNMGPYQVSKADQGSLRTSSSSSSISSLFDFGQSEYTSKQRLNFNFTDSQGNTWAGRCEKQFKGSSTKIKSSGGSSIASHSIDNIAIYPSDLKIRNSEPLSGFNSRRFGAGMVISFQTNGTMKWNRSETPFGWV